MPKVYKTLKTLSHAVCLYRHLWKMIILKSFKFECDTVIGCHYCKSYTLHTSISFLLDIPRSDVSGITEQWKRCLGTKATLSVSLTVTDQVTNNLNNCRVPPNTAMSFNDRAAASQPYITKRQLERCKAHLYWILGQ